METHNSQARVFVLVVIGMLINFCGASEQVFGGRKVWISWKQSPSQVCPCIDIPPPGQWTCQEQKQFGKCDKWWMLWGDFCTVTCGRCQCEGQQILTTSAADEIDCQCSNIAPPGGSTCEQQAKWGKCEAYWMMQATDEAPQGYCQLSCGRCECPGADKFVIEKVVPKVPVIVEGGECRCSDVQPRGSSLSCEEQKQLGKCNADWMFNTDIEEGYCQKTCGRCPTCSESTQVMETLPNSLSQYEESSTDIPPTTVQSSENVFPISSQKIDANLTLQHSNESEDNVTTRANELLVEQESAILEMNAQLAQTEDENILEAGVSYLPPLSQQPVQNFNLTTLLEEEQAYISEEGPVFAPSLEIADIQAQNISKDLSVPSQRIYETQQQDDYITQQSDTSLLGNSYVQQQTTEKYLSDNVTTGFTTNSEESRDSKLRNTDSQLTPTISEYLYEEVDIISWASKLAPQDENTGLVLELATINSNDVNDYDFDVYSASKPALDQSLSQLQNGQVLQQSEVEVSQQLEPAQEQKFLQNHTQDISTIESSSKSITSQVFEPASEFVPQDEFEIQFGQNFTRSTIVLESFDEDVREENLPPLSEAILLQPPVVLESGILQQQLITPQNQVQQNFSSNEQIEPDMEFNLNNVSDEKLGTFESTSTQNFEDNVDDELVKESIYYDEQQLVYPAADDLEFVGYTTNSVLNENSEILDTPLTDIFDEANTNTNELNNLNQIDEFGFPILTSSLLIPEFGYPQTEFEDQNFEVVPFQNQDLSEESEFSNTSSTESGQFSSPQQVLNKQQVTLEIQDDNFVLKVENFDDDIAPVQEQSSDMQALMSLFDDDDIQSELQFIFSSSRGANNSGDQDINSAIQQVLESTAQTPAMKNFNVRDYEFEFSPDSLQINQQVDEQNSFFKLPQSEKTEPPVFESPEFDDKFDDPEAGLSPLQETLPFFANDMKSNISNERTQQSPMVEEINNDLKVLDLETDLSRQLNEDIQIFFAPNLERSFVLYNQEYEEDYSEVYLSDELSTPDFEPLLLPSTTVISRDIFDSPTSLLTEFDEVPSLEEILPSSSDVENRGIEMDKGDLLAPILETGLPDLVISMHYLENITPLENELYDEDENYQGDVFFTLSSEQETAAITPSVEPTLTPTLEQISDSQKDRDDIQIDEMEPSIESFSDSQKFVELPPQVESENNNSLDSQLEDEFSFGPGVEISSQNNSNTMLNNNLNLVQASNQNQSNIFTGNSQNDRVQQLRSIISPLTEPAENLDENDETGFGSLKIPQSETQFQIKQNQNNMFGSYYNLNISPYQEEEEEENLGQESIELEFESMLSPQDESLLPKFNTSLSQVLEQRDVTSQLPNNSNSQLEDALMPIDECVFNIDDLESFVDTDIFKQLIRSSSEVQDTLNNIVQFPVTVFVTNDDGFMQFLQDNDLTIEFLVSDPLFTFSTIILPNVMVTSEDTEQEMMMQSIIQGHNMRVVRQQQSEESGTQMLGASNILQADIKVCEATFHILNAVHLPQLDISFQSTASRDFDQNNPIEVVEN